MYLSYLVYQCSKAAANYGDASFDYESFLTGKAKEDEDYSAFIEKALPIVNEFIQRAYELNKLPAKVATLSFDEDGTLALPDDYGKCVSLFQWNRDGTYRVVGFRKHNRKIAPIPPFRGDFDFQLQYRAKVPYFTEADVVKLEIYSEDEERTVYEMGGNEYESLNDAVEAEDVDLDAEYGISDSLATICVAYCQGRLMDDRSEGHSREMEAESRLNDITLDETLFLQRTMVRRFR